MGFSDKDREIVRSLARQVMEIASLPAQDEKRAMWARLNGLRPVRPMVWINEIPWEEFRDEEDTLRLRSEDEFCRSIEGRLRTTLYLWRHMRTDMVVDPFYMSRYVYEDSGWGIKGVEVASKSDYGRGAYDYVPIMETEADIERIQMPTVTADWDATERNYEITADLIGEVMPVVKQGVSTVWCAPWDVLIHWWGIEELYTDMTDRPEFVHKGAARMMDAFLARLDQLEAQGLLSVGNNNHRVGSGGLGREAITAKAHAIRMRERRCGIRVRSSATAGRHPTRPPVALLPGRAGHDSPSANKPIFAAAPTAAPACGQSRMGGGVRLRI